MAKINKCDMCDRIDCIFGDVRLNGEVLMFQAKEYHETSKRWKRKELQFCERCCDGLNQIINKLNAAVTGVRE